MAKYKLQVQEDAAQPQQWRDVTSAEGELLKFDREIDARARMAALFPVLVKMEAFHADRKRTRVLVIDPYEDVDKER